jgi:hypothetical protein
MIRHLSPPTAIGLWRSFGSAAHSRLELVTQSESFCAARLNSNYCGRFLRKLTSIVPSTTMGTALLTEPAT